MDKSFPSFVLDVFKLLREVFFYLRSKRLIKTVNHIAEVEVDSELTLFPLMGQLLRRFSLPAPCTVHCTLYTFHCMCYFEIMEQID